MKKKLLSMLLVVTLFAVPVCSVAASAESVTEATVVSEVNANEAKIEEGLQTLEIKAEVEQKAEEKPAEKAEEKTAKQGTIKLIIANYKEWLKSHANELFSDITKNVVKIVVIEVAKAFGIKAELKF